MNRQVFFISVSVSLVILITPLVMSQESTHTIITNPAISGRCNKLSEKRKEKLDIKHKVLGLIKRNNNLTKITPDHKKSIAKSLSHNLTRLNQELQIVRLSIDHLEETIIRKGCPGIQL